ncbi:MAG: hypothetical protein LBQ28_01560 [Prevotellaceae bacterium]|jgi:hypothetical protein|nr:hypothetical protein [Prevotellaceae bacterium]
MKVSLAFLFCCVLYACQPSDPLEQTFQLAGNNRAELKKVLTYYKQSGEQQKLKTAEFLIANMLNKYSYDGEIIEKYDTIFRLYHEFALQNKFDREPKIILNTWEELKDQYGLIDVSKLTRIYDCQHLTAKYLIRNIDDAFEMWEKSPLYNPDDFDLFCEYILPYRAGNEKVEVYRQRLSAEFRHILDTITCPESILQGFSAELSNKYISANVLWDYPIELSISKMEKAHHGACRHLTAFGASIMRSCGLPVAIDRAVWANRSLGHSWNVLMLDSGKILPFDALDKRAIKFAYKPAKIFRKTYSLHLDNLKLLNNPDLPSAFALPDEKDVTDEYVDAYDISIPVSLKYDGERKKKYAIICVFDNKEWRAVHWGKIKKRVMHFEKMASDVMYIGAYYDNGIIIPATEPFLLRTDGSIDYCKANSNNTVTMTLQRKYPLSETMKNRAHGLMEMTAEGANRSDFGDASVFFTQTERTYNVTDSLINNLKKFRYIRLNISKTRDANLAEVEFYGKKDINLPEEKLTGKIIGAPMITADTKNPYTNAADGNLETYFIKDKRTNGFIGLDLGKGNERIITHIRYCPRSDTNFILEGDDYELMYWDGKDWQSAGRKTAQQYNNIVFEGVPSGAMYLLHNHTRGKEERIFTYENGEQVWW